MKINYNNLVNQGWFLNWIELVLGSRLSNAIFNCGLDLDKKITENQKAKRFARLQKFMPKGWHIEHTDGKIYIIVDDQVWFLTMLKYGEHANFQ